MNSRHGLKPALQYRGLRFSRTAGEAFRDAEWASAIERPAPKSRPVLRFAAWCAVAWMCMYLIAGGAR